MQWVDRNRMTEIHQELPGAATDSMTLAELYTRDDQMRIKDLMYNKSEHARLHQPNGMRTWVAAGDNPSSPVILSATPYFADIMAQQTFAAGMAELTGYNVVVYDSEEYFLDQENFINSITPYEPVLWPRRIHNAMNAYRDRTGKYPAGLPRSLRREAYNNRTVDDQGEYEAMGEWKGLWPLVDKAMNNLIEYGIIDHPDDPNKRPVVPVGHSKAGLLSLYHAVWLSERGYDVPQVVAGEIAAMRDASIAEGLPKYILETLRKPFNPVAALEKDRYPDGIPPDNELQLAFKPQVRRIGAGVLAKANKEYLATLSRRLAFTGAFARELAPALIIRYIQATAGQSRLTIFGGENSTVSEAATTAEAFADIQDFYGSTKTANISWLLIKDAAHNVTDSQDFFANLCVKSLRGEFDGDGLRMRYIAVS